MFIVIDDSCFVLTFCSIDSQDSKLFFVTNEEAPFYKIISIDFEDKKFKRETFIEQEKDAKLDSASFVNETYLALVYMRNVSLH